LLNRSETSFDEGICDNILKLNFNWFYLITEKQLSLI